MYKRPDNNPFGEWNKIPEHKANMSLNEQEEFEHLWEELCTEDIPESEVTSYLEKLNTNVLNEAGYGEHGWFGVSPFAWTEGFRLNSIFKPLKWLALPLIGGVVLLLAGIWKLLKEGKKQIAIAKVRAWIEKLVVVADSGLKKTRSTKDSLFLIRQRYRRDILQNAVKVATCLGIDIPEKDDKPQEVETSLNESAESLKEHNIIVGHVWKNVASGTEDWIHIHFYTDDPTEEGKFVNYWLLVEENQIKHVDLETVDRSGKKLEGGDFQKVVQEMLSGTNYQKYIVGPIESGKDLSDVIHEGDKLTYQGFEAEQKTEQTSDGQEQSDTMPGQENQSEEAKTSKEHSIDLSSGGLLPDDSRVDWSLMNSIRASQWFGLKHKTTDFWKEAKSVAKVNVSSAQGNPLRECGLITAYVSQSLTLVANSGVAQNYASIMNKYIETLSNVKTSDSAARDSYRYRDDRRFSSKGMSESERAKYKMFEEYFKIFEAAGTPGDNKQKISEWINDSGFVAYLKEINQYNYVMNIIMTMRDKPEVEKSSFDFIKDLYDQYSIKNVEDMVNDFGNEHQEQAQQTQQSKPAEIDSINVDQYLIAALSKVLANTDYTQWNVHADAYKQMLKFIDELTKSVHTVIDSVAKKVEERLGTSQNTFEQAILRFVSSKPDAKQNRSLKNLWDNIGVSKLQQRTIVHCQEIDQSPEMQYYLDMFMITVPKIIKEKLGAMKAEGQNKEEQGGQGSSVNT